MRTYDLREAANLLKMSVEALRQRAAAGKITAYKPGKRWVFLETDLHTYLTGGYAENGQELRATPTRGGKSCRSTNAEKSGGSALPPPTVSAYTNLLKLPTVSQLRNSTTR